MATKKWFYEFQPKITEYLNKHYPNNVLVDQIVSKEYLVETYASANTVLLFKVTKSGRINIYKYFKTLI